MSTEIFLNTKIEYWNPIFVIGNPRSGTTLLRLMLNNHKNIIIPPECGFAIWWYDKYKNWSAADCENEASITSFISDLSVSKKIETWNLDFDSLRRFIQSDRPQSYAELVDHVYRFYAKMIGKNALRWGDKNNFHTSHLDKISQLFDTAQFIIIVRDGRDVACSYRALKSKNINSQYAPNLPTEIPAIANEWVTNNNKIIRFMKNHPNYYMVKYENLVTTPRIVLAEICDFLKEDFDDEMLMYYEKNNTEHQEPVEFLQWKEKTLLEPTTSEIGKYKHILSNDEICFFEQIAGPTLAFFGYLLSSPFEALRGR